MSGPLHTAAPSAAAHAAPPAHAPVDGRRRAWLELAVVLVATGTLPARAFAQAPASGDAAAFTSLSQALTGYPAPDAATAAKVQRAFATPARRASLAALAQVVAATSPADLERVLAERNLAGVANDLVATWYAGVVPGSKSDTVVLYTNAFMWTAMTWTKPMGVCGGVTGYWADPPAP